MNDRFLQTKFHIPAQPPATLSRQQLLSRLNRRLSDGNRFSRRLTLITAPAGYGKTTLAVSWIEERVRVGAWQLPGREQGGRATVLWLSLYYMEIGSGAGTDIYLARQRGPLGP